MSDYIFGLRAVIESIKAGKEIDRVLLKKDSGGDLYHELFSLIKEHKISHQIVPVEKLNRVTKKNHQGAIALVSPITFKDLEETLNSVLESGETPLILALDQVSDVRNFGAIARSAEIAGAHMIIIPEQGSARINADAIKTSAGALHTIPVCRVKNLKDAIYLLQQSDIKVVASTEKGSTLYFDSDFSTPLAIVMGSEDRGISAGILKIADELVLIPQAGKIDSLNVSVAASVMMFEAVRQRR